MLNRESCYNAKISGKEILITCKADRYILKNTNSIKIVQKVIEIKLVLSKG